MKMGTRMYGDFATEAKRKSQRKKSKRSTSLKLGIRFCGSQRFSYSQRGFETIDKYVGRNADEEELKILLKKFFTCRGSLKSEVIDDVMKNVSKIRQKLIDLQEYRFYSSSLLIIYEGEDEQRQSFDEDRQEDSTDCQEFAEASAEDNFKVINKFCLRANKHFVDKSAKSQILQIYCIAFIYVLFLRGGDTVQTDPVG